MNDFLKKYIIFSAVLISIDRIVKWFIVKNNLVNYLVCNGFLLDLVFNRGVSWSLLNDSQFLITGILIPFATVFVLLWLLYDSYKMYQAGESILGYIFVFSGGFSNLLDRFIYKGVVDFIVLFYGDYYFPAFNIADIYIVFGVGLIMLYFMRSLVTVC